MNYILKVVIILLIVCCLTSCSTKSSTSVHDTTIVNYTIKQGQQLPPSEWHCYNVEDQKICIPSTWVFVNQNKFLFLSKIDSTDLNAYFVVLKLNKQTSGLNSATYLKQEYKELKADATEQVTGYKIYKTTYTDKTSFNSEFYTLINNTAYTIYSTVFEKDDELFELALRAKQSGIDIYKEKYQDILFNFYNKNELVFSVKDKIKNVNLIDITKL